MEKLPLLERLFLGVRLLALCESKGDLEVRLLEGGERDLLGREGEPRLPNDLDRDRE
jgi:hypothetical protein